MCYCRAARPRPLGIAQLEVSVVPGRRNRPRRFDNYFAHVVPVGATYACCFSSTVPQTGREMLIAFFDVNSSTDVSICRHDPHGGAYVLVGYTSGSVVLWDAAAHCSISTFDRCVAGLVGIRWMAWAPGNFLALRYDARGRNTALMVEGALPPRPLSDGMQLVPTVFSRRFRQNDTGHRVRVVTL